MFFCITTAALVLLRHATKLTRKALEACQEKAYFPQCACSPACPVAPQTSLDGDGRFPHPLVLREGQPAPDGLLDANAVRAEFSRAERLQVRHLSSPEEQLRPAKAEHVLVLGARQSRSTRAAIRDGVPFDAISAYISSIPTHLDEFFGDILAGLHCIGKQVSLLDKEVIAAKELLVGPPAAAT